MENILVTDNVRHSVWILYALLTFLTFLGWGMKLREKNVDNFLVRLKTFWKIVVFLTIAFSFNFLTTVCLLAFIKYHFTLV